MMSRHSLIHILISWRDLGSSWFLVDASPSEEATNQVTETVSTETTGPLTVAGRKETRV